MDLNQLQELLANAWQGEEQKREIKARLVRIQEELSSLIEFIGGSTEAQPDGAAKTTRTQKDKPESPQEGTAPFKLVAAMSSTEPMTVEQIASAVGMKEGSIKQYLHKFACFRNQRGIGYTCTASSSKQEGQKSKNKRGGSQDK